MKGSNTNLFIIGGVAVVIVVAVLIFSGRPETRLINSATGFEGFRVWLNAKGHSARSFTGGYAIDPNGVGLRVMPLYDLSPDSRRARPTSPEELLTREDERDLSLRNLREKAEAIPTLFVLPKWRSSVRLGEAAHPDFLNTESRVETLLETLLASGVSEVTTDTSGFTTLDGVDIYAMRTFTASACEPVFGSARRMLIGRCEMEGVEREVYILSDPDLINSHGLRFGDNANIATAVVTEIAGDRDILIDYAPRVWTGRARAFETEAREWSDLLNYFKPPFTVLWIGVIAAFLLALWRGWARFGAAAKSLDAGPGAARAVSTAAQARLLRISGDTGALLRAYADARLLALAAEVFGTKAQATEAALWKVLERRAPAACKALREQAATLRQHGMGPAPMYAIDDFEEAIGQVRHELERTP
ncbi:MAG: hypothetical protein AAGA87_09810 [Pseudomonadota bacterium]